MKRFMLFTLCAIFAGMANAQNVQVQNSGDVIYPTSFRVTPPLREIALASPVDKDKDFGGIESPDRTHRPPQIFNYTVADGSQYGDDKSVWQTTMGSRNAGFKAIIKNWAGQVASGFRPFDPSGAAGPNHYIQAINGTPFQVRDKNTGTVLLTANISSLWSPATADDGDPIIMYDKFADRWFISQFGSSGNSIYIAISTTNDPTGSYYAYTYTSPQFPDYLKFSIWENGYYMTSNQTTDRVFCFERNQMLLGNTSARAISQTFTTGTEGAFFVPLPADAADCNSLPDAGTPLPFVAYYDNGWGGGTDGVKIWNMTVTWGTTAVATISTATQVNTSAFDATYDASWNDVTQPGTTQKLDGIGGVLTYRAQWTKWSGYNSLVMNWGIKLSTTQRSIRWVELRQNQSTGVWSLYQEGTYTPDTDTRWMGSIAMDVNGSIALAYCKSSSSTYPTLAYTGRLASDPLGTMTFAETVAAAGTSVQTGTNRFGDYAQTSLDPDGVTFWHTGEYIASGVKTRIYSFQLPLPNAAPVANFSATPTITTCSGDVQFTDLSANAPTSWLWNFGDGQTSTLQNPSHTYASGGSYTVTLTATNTYGNNQIVKTNYLTINIPDVPTATGGSVCGSGTVALSATAATGVLHWYNAATGGTDLGTGTSFTTPSISTTTTYYVDNHIVQPSLYVGPTNNTSGGAYSTTAYSLIFDCYSPCTLVSVSVNKPTAGTVTIQMTTSGGTVLHTGSFTIPAGVSTVALNWDVPVGTGLKLVGPNVGFYRTTPAYPYTLAGYISITSCSTASRYSPFYNWEIRPPDCVSSRVPAVATVNTASVPSVAVSASATTVCSGTSVTFTATPTNGGTTPTYQWQLNGVNVGTGAATYTNTTLANGNTVTCTMNSSLTCVLPTSITSNTVTMTVNSVPAQPSSIAGSTTPCQGSSQVYSVTNVSGLNYTWSFPTGWNVTAGAGTSTVTVTVTVGATAGNIQVTPSNTCGNGTVRTQAVTLGALPAQPSAMVGNTSPCQGSTQVYSVTNVSGLNYTWTLPSGWNVVAGAGTSTVTVTVGATAGNVQVVPSNTCGNGTARTQPVTISTVPAQPSVISGLVTPCQGSIQTYSVTNVSGLNYTWTVPTGWSIVSGTGTNSITVTVGSTSGNVQVTPSNTCGSGTVRSSAVTVSPSVTAQVAVSASANPICSGSAVTFTASPTNGGSTPVYQWYLNGTSIGTNSSTYTNSTLSNNDQVTCMMTSNATCVTGSPTTSTAVTMTVSATAAPVVVLSASDNNICAGTNVTFTAAPSNGGTSPTYQWYLNSAPVGTGTASYTNGSLSNNDIVSCVMTSNLACASPSTATSNNVTMVVTGIVAPTLSVNASSTNICAGTSVTFTANQSNGGTNPTYQWYLNSAPVGNGSTYTNASLVNGSQVYCVMSSDLACASPASVTSNTLVVTVGSTVVPAISVVASETTVCAGTSVVFTATPINGGTTPAYQWYLNGNPVGTGLSTYTNNTLADNDQITCVLTSNLSCASPLSTTSNAVVITVTGAVAPTINVSESANSICAGTSVTFNANTTNEGSTPVYQWFLNGSPIGNNASSFTSSTLNDNDQISCMLYSSLACVSPVSANSNVIAMTVNAAVTPAISISASANPVCASSSVDFTSQIDNGGATPVYQWYVNGIPVGTNLDTYSVSTVSNGDVITCSLSSSEACAVQNNTTSNSISMTVSSSLAVSLTISTLDNSICSGQDAMFTASATNPGSTPVYQWYLNGSPIGTNSLSFTSNSLVDGDVVSCQVTSSESCASGSPASSNSIAMTVFLSPTAPIIYQSGDTLYSSATSGNQWYFMTMGVLIPGAVNSSYVPPVDGEFFVIVTDANGCSSDSSNIIFFQLLSASVSQTGIDFAIFPNPSSGMFYVLMNKANDEPYDLRIINMKGQTIAQHKLNSQRTEIDSHFLINGFYYIEITGKEGIVTKKIQIMK